MSSRYGVSVSFDWKPIIASLDCESNHALGQLAESCPLPLVDYRDEKGFSLVHHAAIKNVPGKVEEIIRLAKTLQGATDA